MNFLRAWCAVSVLLALSLAGCPKPAPPVAAFTCAPTEGVAPLTVAFEDGSTPGDREITVREWDFGDGAKRTGERADHTYFRAGVYTASLTVRSSAGENTATTVITVRDSEPSPEGELPPPEGEVEGEVEGGPVEGETPAEGQPTPELHANFTVTPAEGIVPLRVWFTDLSLSSYAGAITQYQWDFGDDTTGVGAVVSHDYETPGTYDVSLTVSAGILSDTLVREACVVVHSPVEGEGEGEGEGEPEGVQPEGTPPEGDPLEGEPVEGAAEGTPPEGEPVEGQIPEGEPVLGEVRTFADMDFVWIPAGTFQMGSDMTAEEIAAIYGDRTWYFQSEQPRHAVVISKGFWMGRYEVTQRQWTCRMRANPSEFGGEDAPVEQVTWNECQDFIAQLNSEGQGMFRLPTEAEWEYACRAGTSTEFSFGNAASSMPEHGWYFDNSGYKTHPVGQKLPNPWGLFDMHGNVFEWCGDWYGAEYYAESPSTDPAGPTAGEYKVRRGGTFARTISFCRSAFRLWNAPDSRLSSTGVRIVRESDKSAIRP